MATWFFNSFGVPIAFVGMNNLVFHRSGTFIGLLVDREIWDNRARYVGEVIRDNRLFHNKATVHMPKVLPMLPYGPSIPNSPSNQGRLIPPPGFVDLEFDEEGYVIL
jgi:hypothetical protein